MNSVVDSPRGMVVVDDPTCTARAAATAEVLERFAALLRANQNYDDVIFQLLPIVRSWER